MVTHIYGQGDQISLWNHNWEYGIFKHHLPSLFSHALDTIITLKESMQGLIRELFEQVITTMAQEELLTLTGYLIRVVTHGEQTQDDIRWNRMDDGVFTVKSAYQAIITKPQTSTHVHRL